MTIGERAWAEHRARVERCRLSGCTPDEHRCQDSEEDWGDDAA